MAQVPEIVFDFIVVENDPSLLNVMVMLLLKPNVERMLDNLSSTFEAANLPAVLVRTLSDSKTTAGPE